MAYQSRNLIIFACFMMIVPDLCQASLFSTDLIKVNGKTNANCVEYYTYKGMMYCTTKAFSSQPVDPNIIKHETQNIIFDSRPWQAVWKKTTADSTMIEYIPMGDDINNWSELITSQSYSNIPNNVTPKKFADNVIRQLKETGLNPIITFIKESPNQIIFEFQIKNPKNMAQNELQMITKTANGIYILHYAIKKSDMGKINREKWLSNFYKMIIK